MKPAGPNQMLITVWLIREPGDRRLFFKPKPKRAYLVRSKTNRIYAQWQTSVYVLPTKAEIGRTAFLTEDAAKRMLVGLKTREINKARLGPHYGGAIGAAIEGRADYAERSLVKMFDGKPEQIPKLWYDKRTDKPKPT